MVAAPVLLGDREIVLERGVRLVERVGQLIALEDVVLRAGCLPVALLGIDRPADGPERACLPKGFPLAIDARAR